ncbi:2OG-Fe(II) oxygenase [Aliikangiella coralliicola]|nr:2OG-Fe(II) oxygenase [Aliikangiella coralliicola]
MTSFKSSTAASNATPSSEKANEGDLYQFPEPVLLFDNRDVSEQMVQQIQSRLLASPSDQLYQLLLDVYRRTGELARAEELVRRWLEFSPENKLAAYQEKIFTQKMLIPGIYKQSEIQPAPFAIFDKFLEVSERKYFWERALGSSNEFKSSGISYGDGERVEYQYQNRNSEVLFLESQEKQNIKSKILKLIDELFERFLIPKKAIKNIEVKLTAYGEGGFFRIHQDGFFKQGNSSRFISWVYYFHASPKPYSGGDLVLFDSNCAKTNHLFSESHYTRYKPMDNQIVFFPSWFYHGVTPVKLLRPGFDSYRFAVMGHISC